MTLDAQLVVMAKAPVPGRVKTRLTPPYSPGEAGGLAAAALQDTLAAVVATPVRARTVALDGLPGSWLPAGVDVVAQRGTGLDRRIANALTDVWARHRLPVLLVGMDTPQVAADELADAVERLLEPGADAVLGIAEDGGFWALGLRTPRPELVLGVPMSTAGTGPAQRRRLHEHGLRVRPLAMHRDVDTAADVDHVARLAPHGSFAAVAAALRPSTRSVGGAA
jgi:hypothetical protein